MGCERRASEDGVIVIIGLKNPICGCALLPTKLCKMRASRVLRIKNANLVLMDANMADFTLSTIPECFCHRLCSSFMSKVVVVALAFIMRLWLEAWTKENKKASKTSGRCMAAGSESGVE